ncbi:hypothetical protein R1sor_006352 [Riccia sorocarpa]|uniref:Uncharacterized protein n=1 Tax=Riccia sorocarpa TaxID=122646 RepID=A0ABD3HP36_9MARC
MRSWKELRQEYRWDARQGQIPGTLLMWHASYIYQSNMGETSWSWGQCIALLRKGGITTVKEGARLAAGEGWIRYLHGKGIFPEHDAEGDLHRLEDWLKLQRVSEDEVCITQGWIWLEDKAEVRWEQNTSFWTKKFLKPRDFGPLLNGKWGITTVETPWSWRWSKLWSAPALAAIIATKGTLNEWIRTWKAWFGPELDLTLDGDAAVENPPTLDSPNQDDTVGDNSSATSTDTPDSSSSSLDS